MDFRNLLTFRKGHNIIWVSSFPRKLFPKRSLQNTFHKKSLHVATFLWHFIKIVFVSSKCNLYFTLVIIALCAISWYNWRAVTNLLCTCICVKNACISCVWDIGPTLQPLCISEITQNPTKTYIVNTCWCQCNGYWYIYPGDASSRASIAITLGQFDWPDRGE